RVEFVQIRRQRVEPGKRRVIDGWLPRSDVVLRTDACQSGARAKQVARGPGGWSRRCTGGMLARSARTRCGLPRRRRRRADEFLDGYLRRPGNIRRRDRAQATRRPPAVAYITIAGVSPNGRWAIVGTGALSLESVLSPHL